MLHKYYYLTLSELRERTTNLKRWFQLFGDFGYLIFALFVNIEKRNGYITVSFFDAYICGKNWNHQITEITEIIVYVC